MSASAKWTLEGKLLQRNTILSHWFAVSRNYLPFRPKRSIVKTLQTTRLVTDFKKAFKRIQAVLSPALVLEAFENISSSSPRRFKPILTYFENNYIVLNLLVDLSVLNRDFR